MPVPDSGFLSLGCCGIGAAAEKPGKPLLRLHLAA